MKEDALSLEDFLPYRDELIISSKAGWDMWEGPYGFGGSRKYLMASLDQSLERMGLDYVDIFYHHRPDPDTPLEETMYALRDIVASGKALYVGISSYGPELTAEAAQFMAEEGCPLIINQPSYSIVNRWVEEPGEDGDSLLTAAADSGLGTIAFSPLAQGLLTDRYLGGVPADSRAAAAKSLSGDMLSEENLTMISRLNDIAQEREQSLAQMARDTRNRIEEAMDDDFNTALAVAELFAFSREINSALARGMSEKELLLARKVLKDFAIDILGIVQEDATAVVEDSGLTARLMELIIEIRTTARSEKNWPLADRIRDRLKEAGILLEDTPEGPRWKVQ